MDTAREGGKDREVELDADRCQDEDKSSPYISFSRKIFCREAVGG